MVKLNRQELAEAVKGLHAVVEKPELCIRLIEVDFLIEDYIGDNGDVPDSKILTSMANYLLVDHLTDQYKHYRKQEYPIKTKNQVYKQNKRHIAIQQFDIA